MRHVLVQPSARTTSGASGALRVDESVSVALYVDVTAVSGSSPTLAVALQESDDQGVTWFDARTSPTITAPGKHVLQAGAPVTGLLRAAYTIGGGSPSFTFSVVLRH